MIQTLSILFFITTIIVGILAVKDAVKINKLKNTPKDGSIAYQKGFKLEDNPFKKHTADHSIWRDDWLFSAGRFI